MFQLDLKGFDEVLKAIEELKDSIGEKVLQDIASKAAKEIIVDDLKKSAPTDEASTKKSMNQLVNNIKVKRRILGVQVGFDKRKAYYLRWLEFGTKVRQTKGRGKYGKGVNRGAMSRRPFVAASYERSVPKLIEYMNNNITTIALRSLKRRLKSI